MKRTSHKSEDRRRHVADWIAFGFLMVFASANIFGTVFMIPKFQHLYYDMLGDRPLPSTTSLILHWKYLFEALAFVYLGVGLRFAFVTSSRIGWRLFLAISGAAILQAAFMMWALCLPLVGGLTSGLR
jgi:hypothetical protein